MWHPSVVMQVILAILGVIALFADVAGWSLETEYGGDKSAGSTEFLPDATARVYDVDEQVIDAEGHPEQVLVFEGSQVEADAWVAQQEGRGRNYLIPTLIIVLGVVLVGAALFPSRPDRNRTNRAGDRP